MSYTELFFSAHPKKFREKVREQSQYADIERYKQASLSISLLSVGFVGLMAYFIPYSNNVRLSFFGVLGVAAYFVMPVLALSVAAEKRKKEMEHVLPDALLLISTNIKSGSSINRAFLASARQEFGPLEDELRRTAIEISGGKPVEQALDNLRNRVNSELFSDTLKILSNAIESGGNTTELLDSSAADIRSSLELRNEIKSNIRMYVMFILIAAVVGAPMLFSITTYMAETTTSMWEQTDLQNAGQFAGGGSQGIQFRQPSISPDFLAQFSVAALIISNSFASLIISQIKNGNIKEGAKYIPFTVFTSVVIYFLVKMTISGVL